MPQTQTPASSEAAIWSRLVEPDKPGFPPAAAEAILAIEFSQADKDRMKQLMAKAKEGALTDEEQAEVDAFSRVGSLLGILKSKARKSLKKGPNKAAMSKAH